MYRKNTKVHMHISQGFQSPKKKRKGNYKWFSLHKHRGSEMLFLALIHTRPRSSLRAALQSDREQVLL